MVIMEIRVSKARANHIILVWGMLLISKFQLGAMREVYGCCGTPR